MRRTLILLSLTALLVPVAALAATRSAGDGTLSIQGGRGKVVITARGAVIARFDRGTVTITDRTPGDGSEPIVAGDELARPIGDNTVVYSGRDIRFRLIGGAYKIQLRASGIDLSAAGSGTVQLQGEGFEPGVYSFTEDCGSAAALCEPLPARLTKYRLGSGADRPAPVERGERERSD